MVRSDKVLAGELIGFSKEHFIAESYAEFDQLLVQHLYDERDWKLRLVPKVRPEFS